MKRLLASGMLAVASLASLAHAQTTPAPFGSYQRLFSADSLWNSYPVNPVLDSYVIPNTATNWDPVIKQGPYSSGIFEAKASDLPMVIYPRDARGVWDPDGETFFSSMTIPHWPAGTIGATGTDGHADIVDATGNKIYSLFQLKKDTGGRWTASTVAWAPLGGSGWGDPAHYQQGARAAGVPTSAGMIRIAEAADTSTDPYPHALAMSLDFSALLPAPNHYVYPATSGDSTVARANTGQIPEGARLMLPPSFDLSKITNARLLKVAKTLKKYGAYVVDRNVDTPFAIYVENGAVWSSYFPQNELFLIKNALRRVIAQDGHINGAGQLRVPESRVNLLSMRGSWKRVSGDDAPGVYDTFSQALTWGATTKYLKQTNYFDNGLGRVKNSYPSAPNRYQLSVESVGGARLSMAIFVNGVQQAVTPMLGNGQSYAVLWPAGGKPTFTAEKYPGAAGWVRAKLVALPPGQ